MLGDIVDRILREELVGERADRREWLWHRLWELDRTEEFPIWLFGIVDVALWDLEGRPFGVPVHRLLGTYRDSIPACASTTTFADDRGVPRRLRPVPRARVSRRSSFMPGEMPALTPSSASGPRDHVGPDVDLMYDGSAAFDLPDAVYVGDALSGGGLPLVRGADAGVQRHGIQVACPSASTFPFSSERPRTAVTSTPPTSSPRVVRPTSARARITAAASPARCASPISPTRSGCVRRCTARPRSAVHLCMAIPNCTYYESLVTSNPATREARVGPDGLVRAPTEPGIALPSFVHDQRATSIN